MSVGTTVVVSSGKFVQNNMLMNWCGDTCCDPSNGNKRQPKE